MVSSKRVPRRIAVYCGSAFGNNPVFRAEAVNLGTAIAQAGIGLVYGGACRGLMGALADAALAAGGEVIGVLPDALKGREIAHNGLTSLELVSTMHERKARIHAACLTPFSRCPAALAPSMNCSKPLPGRRSACTPSPAS